MDMYVPRLRIVAMDDDFECIGGNESSGDGYAGVVIGRDCHLGAGANSTEVALGSHVRNGSRRSGAGDFERLFSRHRLRRPMASGGNPVIPGQQWREPKQRVDFTDRAVLA